VDVVAVDGVRLVGVVGCAYVRRYVWWCVAREELIEQGLDIKTDGLPQGWKWAPSGCIVCRDGED